MSESTEPAESTIRQPEPAESTIRQPEPAASTIRPPEAALRYHLETLGCPKNQVDSDKLAGRLASEGYLPAGSAEDADLVVVNTCAFIEAARQESIDTVLALDGVRRDGARLVVTGCMAERYGAELADALPEVDLVAGFGVPVTIGRRTGGGGGEQDHATLPSFDLLNLPRPTSSSPWAYVKVAEGCDRACGFCAIPSFRGKQRSHEVASILAEVDALDAREIVLVAQDLASFGRDTGGRTRGLNTGSDERPIVGLLREIGARVPWTRLLYLYPSDLTDELIDAICATDVPYFDLSLQHVSRRHLKAMRRWGDGDRFLSRIVDIRNRQPGAAFRSSFIVGYPGETEADHDQLLAFVESAQLDWAGFFAYSPEDGTHAAGLDGQIDANLVAQRLAEVTELQDAITAAKRDAVVDTVVEVLVDEVGVARSYREAPEIDGIITVPATLAVGQFHKVRITGAEGPDLFAVPEGSVG